MFSINEHSPQSVAVSILNLAGFSVSANAISNDPAFWFYEVLISMFEETPASKKKLSIKPLTLKSIELGTNGGQRSKDLIKNSSPLLKLFPSKENKSQEEINIAALNELFIKKRNCLPKREDLVFITKKKLTNLIRSVQRSHMINIENPFSSNCLARIASCTTFLSTH